MAIVWSLGCRVPDRCAGGQHRHVLESFRGARFLRGGCATASLLICFKVDNLAQSLARNSIEEAYASNNRLLYTQLHSVTNNPRHFPYQRESFKQHLSTHESNTQLFRLTWATRLLTGCSNEQIRELFTSSTRSKPREGSGSHATSALQAYLKPRQRAATALTTLSIRSNSLAYVVLTRQSSGADAKISDAGMEF